MTVAALVRRISGGLLLWAIGMVVGSVVFAVPLLRSIGEVRYVTSNPMITVPVVLLWAPVAYALARRFAADSESPRTDGLHVGVVFLASNLVLDLVVVVWAMRAGVEFYGYVGLWFAYAVLLVAPWRAGCARAAVPLATR